MNLIQASNALKAYTAANIPTFIWGAPGIGKSDLARAVAADSGVKLIDQRAILLDPVDLRGLPTVADGRASWAQPDFLPRVDRDGPAGFLFLDELNAAPASVQAACFQLVLDRRLGEYVLPAEWRIVAAGNRQSDRAAAQRMPTPLANRFAHIDAEADVTAWARWATKQNIAAMVLAFIRFRPELLHKMEGSDLRAFPSPRAWATVARLPQIQIVGTADKEADAFRQALAAGIIGEAAAAELEGFIRVWRSLPTIADIIANPDKVKVPNDPATLYAISTALARKADAKNFDPILRFAKRALGKEFCILLCVDATARDKDLMQTRAFIEWASDNQDVTL